MAFSENLKRIRESKGLKQSDIAKGINVSDRTISMWERGKMIPSLDAAIKIASLLGVSLDELVEDEETFIFQAKEQFGSRGRQQAKELVSQLSGLFAGGELSEDDRDAVYRAMTEAYFDAKERAKKYTPKKYQNSD